LSDLAFQAMIFSGKSRVPTSIEQILDQIADMLQTDKQLRV
jgi:hypothetical protein